MNKGIKILKTTVYILAMAFFIATIILSLLTIKGGPQGTKLFIVSSGSMEPKINIGDIVVVKKAEDYKKDDIVTFYREGTTKNSSNTATHRIIEVLTHEITGEVTYKTKGDANEDPDISPLKPEQILGKMVFRIPLFGKLVAFVKTQMGFMLVIVVPSIIIIYNEFLNMKLEIKKMVLKKKQEKEAAKKEVTDEK